MLAAGMGSDALAVPVLRLLDEAGLDPGTIAAVVTARLGYPGNDSYEAAVLRAIFGDSPPPVVSPTERLGDPVSALNLFQVMAGLATIAEHPCNTAVLVIASEPSGRIGTALFQSPADKAEKT
jgi:3-oxoacyl-(acyl-carrier-protein) synthase